MSTTLAERDLDPAPTRTRRFGVKGFSMVVLAVAAVVTHCHAGPNDVPMNRSRPPMPLSIFQVSIPVFLRGLDVLAALLRKGEAHAAEAGGESAALVAARLAPDMLTLAGQVQRASDTAKFAAARLTGTEPPRVADDEVNFGELQNRIEWTATYLQGFTPEQFADSETKTISFGTGASARSLTGDDYVLSFALPNFFFHVTTAYDILRHNGVPIGKRDYLWPAG